MNISFQGAYRIPFYNQQYAEIVANNIKNRENKNTPVEVTALMSDVVYLSDAGPLTDKKILLDAAEKSDINRDIVKDAVEDFFIFRLPKRVK